MKVLSKVSGKEVLDQIRAREPVNWDKHVKEVTGPTAASDDEIKRLKNALEQMKPKYQNIQSPGVGGRFEAEASAIVHQTLTLSAEAAADAEYWIYLSVREFADLIEWRHGGNGNFAREANYGLETRWDGLMLRLWMRGEIGLDPETESYGLAQLGDQDFWRSHILRQNFASCRTFARAFIVEVYKPDDFKRPPLTTPQIRELAPRLRRLYATIPYEVLSVQEARAIVKEEISRILEPQR